VRGRSAPHVSYLIDTKGLKPAPGAKLADHLASTLWSKVVLGRELIKRVRADDGPDAASAFMCSCALL
jgi:hypothetical protein